MDVLDDYNRSDYYTPTIAQEIYLSPCFHYFIHTLYIAKPTHMELLLGTTRRTLNDLRFTFVCEGEQFGIRETGHNSLCRRVKKKKGTSQNNIVQRRRKTKIQTWCESDISISCTKIRVQKWLDFKRQVPLLSSHVTFTLWSQKEKGFLQNNGYIVILTFIRAKATAKQCYDALLAEVPLGL